MNNKLSINKGMLKTFYSVYDPKETNNQANLRCINDIKEALDEAHDLISSLYADYCEAARLLKEHGIKTCVDTPQEKAEAILDTMASFKQIKTHLDNWAINSEFNEKRNDGKMIVEDSSRKASITCKIKEANWGQE